MMSEEKTNLFLDVIRMFHEHGLLEHFIVVGSWTHLFYREYFKEKEDITAIRTTDIDLMLPNSRKAFVPTDIPKLLEPMGFLEEIRWPDGYAKYVHRELLIEFLAPLRGSGEIDLYDVKPLNIKVQTIRFMEMLYSHSMKVDFEGFKVWVPMPQSYVLHKVLINDRRRNPVKKEKDLETIRNLSAYLLKDEKQCEIFREIYISFPKKWKKRALEMTEEKVPALYALLKDI